MAMTTPDLLHEIVRPLEQELGTRPGFFSDLLEEDDWSFIVKSHAFIEAALSHILVKATGKDLLREVFTSLELSNPRTGKLAFATALKLLDRQDRRFHRYRGGLQPRGVRRLA